MQRKQNPNWTACQNMIAKVILLGNKHNATLEQLRTDHAWRSYVCSCTDSSHYKWITGQEGLSEAGSGVKAVATDYQSPTSKKVFKARIIDVPARTVQSHCGVSIFIPAHKGTLQGKSLAYLLATKS